MGFLSGLFGKPKPPPPSKAERFQAERSVRRLEEWEDDGYKALEQEGIQRSQDDIGGFLRGRASADVNAASAQGEKMTGMLAGQGSMASAAGEQTRTTLGALLKAKGLATVSAEEMKDKRKIGMAKVGQDVALTTDNVLANASQRGVQSAMQDMKNQQIRNIGRTNALLSVAQGAAMRDWGGGKKQTGSIGVNDYDPSGKPGANPGMGMNQNRLLN